MSSTPAARAFIIFIGAIAATAILVVGLLVTTKGKADKTAEQSEENFDILEDQASILRIVLAVTGCTVDDTMEQCQEKAKANSARSIVELDCRIRLAVQSLPAPEPGTTCVPPPPTTTTVTTVPPPPPPPPPIPPPG